MTVALSSLISGRPVRNDVAMTGEVTLTGQVLPIGGLKEKSLAAQRAGIKRVIVPERNEGDVEEIPEHERSEPRVRLRRRGLQGDRRRARLGWRWRPPARSAGAACVGFARSVREAVRARSRAFWIVAGLTAARRGAALRHPRRPVLPPRRDRHRQPHPARRLRPRDGRGRLQRVGAAALLRARLALDAGDRHRGVRAALALGAGRGGDGAGRLPARRSSCAAAAPGSSPRRWSRSTRCCSGTRRRRAAYALFVLFCAVSRALLRPRARPRRAAATSSAGGSPRRWPSRPTTSPIFPIAVEARLAAAPPRPGEPGAGSAIVVLAGLALAPLAIHQMSLGHAEWIGDLSLGHRLWEAGVDLRRSARPATSSPGPSARCRRSCRCLLVARRARAARLRAASAASAAPPAMPLALAARHRRAPAGAGDRSPRQGLRPRPQPDARRWCRCWSRSRSASPCAAPAAPALAVGAALFAYSLGFCVWASVSPALQRPDWDAVAAQLGEPTAPRAMVTWTLGQASLRHYLSTGSFQVCPVGRLRLVRARNRLHLRRRRRRRCRGRLLGPGFRQVGYEQVGALSDPALRAAGARCWPGCGCGRCAMPRSTSASTASSSTASARADAAGSALRRYPERPRVSSEEKAWPRQQGDPDRRPRRRHLLDRAREPLRAATDRGRRAARQPARTPSKRRAAPTAARPATARARSRP